MGKPGFALLLLSNLWWSQTGQMKDFQKIPDVFDTPENLYPFIKPSKDFAYWKAFTNHTDPEKAVLYESQYPEPMTILEPAPEQGFFQKCLSENCFHYIIACKNDRPEYFADVKALRKFIGEINNVGEAVLIANTYGYSVDIKNPEGGSFRKDDSNFYLKTYRSEKCSDVKESFLLIINIKSGELKVQSRGIYTEKKSCRQ
ncbi:hypothetical protein ASG31_06025 [Chryseobacterium sp. Leaf404]|uniref:hypothetical protein n=1 Tax=unclassified Chryseobacterium TaxID=2593645 RepID=UPI0006FD7141|nr:MULTISPECIES: hypothetical protein [unclassified Chryseobacterium]KQT18282.1 hypothetical protein ASG31_06025 [Chryseobacterium sp. Leaf404]